VIGRDWPVPFGVQRDEDPTGISGTGLVAAGVIWPDRRVAMRWAGNTPPTGYPHCVRQVNLFDHVDEVEGVHSHSGRTRVQKRDPAVPCVDLGLAVFGIVAWYGPRSRVTHWGVRWDRGPAVTWRADPDRPTRIEQWPEGAAAAFQELGDLSADEARLAWVPSDALMIASAAASIEGRRWRVAARGKTAADKSPRRR
jgi:hypothetical protein